MEEFIEAILSGQDERAEPAVAALADYGSDAVAALERRLPGAPEDARWWIARTFAAIPSPQSAVLLAQMMHDSSPNVRACAALALGELGEISGAPGAEALAAHLADPSGHVAEICAVALSRIGQTAVPALLRALQGGPSERIRACRALVPIESHDAIPALIHALDDEEAMVTYFAEDALARMGVGMMLLKP